MHIAKHSTFHSADSQDHGRLSVVHRSKVSREKNLYTRIRLLRRHFKKKKELRARTPVLTHLPAQANRNTSRRRWFRTNQSAEKLARMCRLLGLCLETLLGIWFVRQQRETLRCDAGGNWFGGLDAVQRRTPGAVRCTAPS